MELPVPALRSRYIGFVTRHPMLSQSTSIPSPEPPVRASHVAWIAAVCLILGLATGFLLRRSQGSAPQPESVAGRASLPASAGPAHSAQPPTLDEMRHMADERAAPILEKLKTDPGNVALLAQAGSIYHASHQFSEAAAWYRKAVERDPQNVAMRIHLATSLYRSGDADGAMAQLNEALKLEPTNPDALFNLGLIRLQAKRDSPGARACWSKLLKTNPNLTTAQKNQVQSLMATASAPNRAGSAAEGSPE